MRQSQLFYKTKKSGLDKGGKTCIIKNVNLAVVIF